MHVTYVVTNILCIWLTDYYLAKVIKHVKFMKTVSNSKIQLVTYAYITNTKFCSEPRVKSTFHS